MSRRLSFSRALLAAALLLAGCSVERHYSDIVPERNQAVRVESGDRFYFDLKENTTTGYEWIATCDDPDVSVTITHERNDTDNGLVGAPGVAKVEVRVHRGYDGPSTVRFRYKRRWEKDFAKQFTITLYKDVGDRAFWK